MEKPQIIITTVKRGDEITYPKKGNHLRIHFEAFRPNGEKIETTKDADHPFEFQIGVDDVIPGLQQILYKMTIGEKVKAEIPPQFAYQREGLTGIIPSNEKLIMEIELQSIWLTQIDYTQFYYNIYNILIIITSLLYQRVWM